MHILRHLILLQLIARSQNINTRTYVYCMYAHIIDLNIHMTHTICSHVLYSMYAVIQQINCIINARVFQVCTHNRLKYTHDTRYTRTYYIFVCTNNKLNYTRYTRTYYRYLTIMLCKKNIFSTFFHQCIVVTITIRSLN